MLPAPASTDTAWVAQTMDVSFLGIEKPRSSKVGEAECLPRPLLLPGKQHLPTTSSHGLSEV